MREGQTFDGGRRRIPHNLPLECFRLQLSGIGIEFEDEEEECDGKNAGFM